MSPLPGTRIFHQDDNPVTENNPFPVKTVYNYVTKWFNNTHFSAGTFNNTEISGSDSSALIQLTEATDTTSNIEFSTTTNYSYTASQIQITSSAATLTPVSGVSKTWPFDSSANYTFDSDKIYVTNGTATLRGVTNVHVHYHLNETAGSVVSDSSGNNHTATAVNMEDADWVAGKLNNCLQFDGTNEYVNCGDIADFERTDPFSIETWLKTTGTSMDIMTRYSGKGWICYVASSGKVFFSLRNTAATNEASRYSSGIVNSGSWIHLIVTYDGSSDNSGIKIYINGSDDTDSGSGVNTLSDTIKISANMYLGGRIGSASFNGQLDEVLVYEKELSSDEVSQRWNAGNGTEIGGISMDNPTIVPNDGMTFSNSVDYFTHTASIPANSAIRYIVSSDSGSTYQWWDGVGWTVSTETYSQSSSFTDVSNNISTLATTGTFYWKAFLHSTDGAANPILEEIYAEDNISYTVGSYELIYLNDINPSPNFGWVGVTETSTVPTHTSIKYQYSHDSGATWSGTWLSKETLESTMIGLSVGNMRFKFQLTTDTNTSTPELGNVGIISDNGYATSGTFISNEYDCNYLFQDWNEINWSVSAPSGTSIVIKARAGNDSGNLGTYSSALTNNEDTNLTGRYFQWKAEFSTSGHYTAQLDSLGIKWLISTGAVLPGAT